MEGKKQSRLERALLPQEERKVGECEVGMGLGGGLDQMCLILSDQGGNGVGESMVFLVDMVGPELRVLVELGKQVGWQNEGGKSMGFPQGEYMAQRMM